MGKVISVQPGSHLGQLWSLSLMIFQNRPSGGENWKPLILSVRQEQGGGGSSWNYQWLPSMSVHWAPDVLSDSRDGRKLPLSSSRTDNLSHGWLSAPTRATKGGMKMIRAGRQKDVFDLKVVELQVPLGVPLNWESGKARMLVSMTEEAGVVL